MFDNFGGTGVSLIFSYYLSFISCAPLYFSYYEEREKKSILASSSSFYFCSQDFLALSCDFFVSQNFQ